MENFALCVKSTIDKLIYDLATANNYRFFDLDGSYMAADQVESEKSAIAWSLLSLTEHPRDPFWNLQFEVGAQTSNDSSQYDSVKITALIQNLFSVGDSFYLADYSGVDLPTVNAGEMHIALSSSAPPAFDRTSGLRCVHVTATVQRFT